MSIEIQDCFIVRIKEDPTLVLDFLTFQSTSGVYPFRFSLGGGSSEEYFLSKYRDKVEAYFDAYIEPEEIHGTS